MFSEWAPNANRFVASDDAVSKSEVRMRIRLLSGLTVLLGLAQGLPAAAQLRTATVGTTGTLSGAGQPKRTTLNP